MRIDIAIVAACVFVEMLLFLHLLVEILPLWQRLDTSIACVISGVVLNVVLRFMLIGWMVASWLPHVVILNILVILLGHSDCLIGLGNACLETKT